jgi:hypothetical protein
MSSGQDFRMFTNRQGQVVEAYITDYSPARNEVQLCTRGMRRFWVDPAIFSDTDRQYIEIWGKSAWFMDPMAFKITVEEKQGEWRSTGKEGLTSRNREEQTIRYRVELHNASADETERIRIEYCIYIEKEYGESEYIDIKTYSKLLGRMKPGEEDSFYTPRLKSTKRAVGGDQTVLGARFRFHHGHAVREVTWPRFLPHKKFPWLPPKTEK